MQHAPRPRRHVFDIYWKFAAERQAIFEKRIAGQASPWTNDAILRTYKFCNVYRAADRVSQYLIREVAYGDGGYGFEDILFQIAAFRLFSKPSTWEGVKRILGETPTIADLKSGALERAFDQLWADGTTMYTSAFILCATNAYGKPRKHQNHVALLHQMFVTDGLASKVVNSKSLADVFSLLRQYPLMGDFMSYQIAIDLNYSEHLNFSENDFTKAGPGALRGIRKAFEDTGDFSPEDVIQYMVDHQAEEFSRLGLRFKGLWGRPLHAIDCQGLFCETDKYCREAVPDLKSNRSRIKARYERSPDDLTFYFPPKWGLNGQIDGRVEATQLPIPAQVRELVRA